jgi:hypothetical protein
MSLPRKDLFATGLVGIAVVLYLLWAIDLTLPGMSSTRATAVGVLALGFAASALAVVPDFDQLIRGSRTYLATTSLLGLVALAAGVQVLLSPGGLALSVLIAVMVVLWAISTVHHQLLARNEGPQARVGSPGTADRHSRSR